MFDFSILTMISKIAAPNSFSCQAKPPNAPLRKEFRNNFATPSAQDAFQKSKEVYFGATVQNANDDEKQKAIRDMKYFIYEGIIEACIRTKGDITMPKGILIVSPHNKSGSGVLSVSVSDGVMYGRALSAENKIGRCPEVAKKILNSNLFKKDETGATFLSKLPNSADYDELIRTLYKLKENPASASVKEIQFISCNISRWLGKALELPLTMSELLENCIVSPYRNIFHELGHLAHFESMGKDWKLYKSMDKGSGALTLEFKSDPEKIEIARKITAYATQSPNEFVAEVYTDILEGKKIPDDAMRLYRKYHGPKVPEVTI